MTKDDRTGVIELWISGAAELALGLPDQAPAGVELVRTALAGGHRRTSLYRLEPAAATRLLRLSQLGTRWATRDPLLEGALRATAHDLEGALKQRRAS